MNMVKFIPTGMVALGSAMVAVSIYADSLGDLSIMYGAAENYCTTGEPNDASKCSAGDGAVEGGQCSQEGVNCNSKTGQKCAEGGTNSRCSPVAAGELCTGKRFNCVGKGKYKFADNNVGRKCGNITAVSISQNPGCKQRQE